MIIYLFQYQQSNISYFMFSVFGKYDRIDREIERKERFIPYSTNSQHQHQQEEQQQQQEPTTALLCEYLFFVQQLLYCWVDPCWQCISFSDGSGRYMHGCMHADIPSPTNQKQ
jgi:hypothetical protein